MNFETKKQLKDKAGLAYGLANVLKYNTELLMEDISNRDIYKLKSTIADTDKTLHTLILIVEELEYILNLDKNMRP